MTTNLADLLIEKINEKRNPCVVGLDPRISLIPAHIRETCLQQYGDTIEGTCQAILYFNCEIIDAVSDIVAIVKPQMAFYEQYGFEGVRAFQETVRYAKMKDLLIIEDAKRNDIESTALAYAMGHLGEVELLNSMRSIYGVDMLTVNPYLGSDGIKPFIKVCEEYGKGIFILTKTSNPSAGDFQDLKTGDDEVPLYLHIAKYISSVANELIGKKGYSPIGAVIGATYPKEAKLLREVMKTSFFLVPGYGKQGVTAQDIEPYFNEDGYGALVSSSRAVTFAYLDSESSKYPQLDYLESVRKAAIRMRDDVLSMMRRYGKIPKGW